MKKRILLLALLLIPFGVKAEEMKIECDKTTAAPNSEVNCSIKTYDTEVSGADGKVSVTNGVVTKAQKNTCGFGDVTETEFTCSDLVQPTSMTIATYTIKVGESGVTTFEIKNPSFVGTNFVTYDKYVVAPVNITISSGEITPEPKPVDPTPSNPTEPEKQEPTTPSENTTQPEQKNNEKEKIENPETGAFLNTTLVIIALGCASYVAYKVAKKQKFFRL